MLDTPTRISADSRARLNTVLMDAGYVEQRKAVRDTRQRVWLRMTGPGHTAYQEHLAALRAIVGQ